MQQHHALAVSANHGQRAKEPLWRTIADSVERALLEPGHPWRTTHLPTAAQLGHHFGVGPTTVRRALRHLDDTGMVRLVVIPVDGRHRRTWVSAYHAQTTTIRPWRYSPEEIEHTAAALLRFARPFGWTTLPGAEVLARRLGVSSRRVKAALLVLARRHQAVRQRVPRSGNRPAWRLNPGNTTPITDPLPDVPIATLVVDHMINRVRAGEFCYRTDGRVYHPPLPTQKEMAQRYGISEKMCRKVIAELARRGVYVLEPGSNGLVPRLPKDTLVVDLPDHPGGRSAVPRMPPRHTAKPVMVAEDIADRIRVGEFRAGHRLPQTKNDLAVEYGIDAKTMGLALDRLYAAGWITYLRPGTGQRKVPVVAQAPPTSRYSRPVGSTTSPVLRAEPDPQAVTGRRSAAGPSTTTRLPGRHRDGSPDDHGRKT